MLKILDSKRGFAHIGIILLLLAIGIGVYLVSQKTNLAPKASGETIQIVDDNGNPITTTTSQTVKVKLSPETQINGLASRNTESVGDLNKPKPSSSGIPKGYVQVSGRFLDRLNPGGGVKGYIEYCNPAKKGALTKVTASYDGYFSFNIQKGKTFCIKASSSTGYLIPSAVNARSQDKLSYESQIAGIDCSKDKSGNCKPAIVKSLDLAVDNQFDFVYSPIPSPVPTLYPSGQPSPTPFPSHSATPTPTVIPSVSPSPNQPTPVAVILAEDPNFNVNSITLGSHIQGAIIQYTFSNANPGIKLIYAQYTYSDGTIVNAIPFPASIELISTASPSPSTSTPLPSPSTTPTPSPRGDLQFDLSCNSTQVNFMASGLVPNRGNNGYWTKVTDDSSGIFVIASFNEINDIGLNFTDFVPSIRGESTNLQLIPDGRSYTLSVYYAPFTTGYPYLPDPPVVKITKVLNRGCLPENYVRLNLTILSNVSFSGERKLPGAEIVVQPTNTTYLSQVLTSGTTNPVGFYAPGSTWRDSYNALNVFIKPPASFNGQSGADYCGILWHRDLTNGDNIYTRGFSFSPFLLKSSGNCTDSGWYPVFN